MEYMVRPPRPELTYGQQPAGEVPQGRGRPDDPRDIPAVRPGDPRIPPPDPEPASIGQTAGDEIDAAIQRATEAMRQSGGSSDAAIPAAVSVLEAIAQAPRRRVMLTYGPDPSTVCVSVEESPDWEVVDDGVFEISREAIVELMPLLKLIVPVKNLVPGLVNGQRTLQAHQEQVRPEAPGAGAGEGKAGTKRRSRRAAPDSG